MNKYEGISHALAMEVLESVDAAVFVEDFDGNILYVNNRACEIYGYTKDDFYSAGVGLIIPDFEMKRVGEIRTKLYENGKIEFEAINIAQGGCMIPVKIYAKISDLGGKSVVVLTVYDLRPQRAYENVLHLLGEHALESIIITNGEGTIIFWNPQSEKLFGCSKGEIIGTKIQKIFTQEAEREFSRIFAPESRSYHTVPRFFRAPLKKCNGDEFFAEVSCTLVRERSMSYVIVLVRDVSREIENEKKREYELSQYRTILDKMLGGVVIIRDEKIVYSNRGFEVISGYDVRGIINADFTMIVHPEDRSIALDCYRRRMAGEPAPEEYVVRLLRSDGNVLWVVVKAVKIIIDGKPADLVSMVDITRIKGMERLLFKVDEVVRKLNAMQSDRDIRRTVWEMMRKELHIDAMYFVTWNGKLNEIERFGKEVRFSGKQCIRELEQGTVYIPDAKDCGLSEVSVYAVPLRDESYDFGAMIVIRCGYDSIPSNERNIIDLLGAHVFLSLRNLDAMNQIRKSRNLQELLVHILTHDLKTHLAVINGYTDLLFEECNPEYVTEIKCAVTNAVDIIDKTNMFSKLDLERIKQAQQCMEIASLLEGAISLVRHKNPDANVRVENGHDAITCYALLMKEALYNLINNAFVHGAKNVVVKTESGEDRIRIKVIDDGPGIPDKLRDKIFDPFFKYMSSGSGLGLAIVKRIIELHKGKIWVEPNTPKGSVFVIELPKGE